MARDRQYRAPQHYGAWVGGEFFNPGSPLPAGTRRYRVVAVERAPDGLRQWRTVSHVFDVGTSIDDIDSEIAAMFQELWEEDYKIRMT